MRAIKPDYLPNYLRNDGLPVALMLFMVLSSILVAMLPEHLVILGGVLLLGLPLVALVVSKKTRNTAVIIMLVLLPVISILKAVTGSRFAPLIFDLGLLFACILHLSEGLLHGKLRLGRLDLLLLLLWVMALLEIFNPNVPSLQAGIEGFRKFIFMSAAFYLSRHLLQLRDIRLFIKGIILLSVPVTVYGIKQFFVMWPIDYKMIELATSSATTFLMGGWIRPFSTMSGPFQLGLYLTIILLLILALLKRKTTCQYQRILLTGLLILQITLLLMTRTKGNWVGFFIGVFILFILQSHNPVRALIRMSIFSLAGGAIIFLVLFFTSGVVSNVLDEALFAITHPLQAPTLIYRLDLWQETIIPAIEQHPFLGYGTGSAGEGLRNLYEGTRSIYFFSHNLYIKIWLEMGLIGLLLFLWIVIKSLKNGLGQIHKPTAQNLETTWILQWSAAVVIAFLVSGTVIATLDAFPPNYYFWILLGLLSRAKTFGEPK